MMNLNQMQQDAVEHVDGPLLILAGAGSGKTRVITYRAAYLLRECGVAPWNILAITFTNKAAQEMRERIAQEVGMGAEAIWVSTFHSMCVRILRRYIDRLGYETNFTIYDTDDSKTLMKRIIKRKNLDTKKWKERGVLAAISSAKNELIGPQEYSLNAQGNFADRTRAELYTAYQKELRKNNAVDFDDLICLTVLLLQEHADVRDYYQERFRYIMVDEYQDTNTAQFRLISLLADKYKNLCVVGDDDQSIYKFRGANIHNILDFERHYPQSKVIRLEENYRSTQRILDAANGVISHNRSRKGKTLWTGNEIGEKIIFQQFDAAYDEANYVTSQIRRGLENGASLLDYAVLYRTNAQSRLFEEKFVAANIPYKIVGGVNFYGRREIKDLLAYLKVLDNPSDDLSVRRIINVPKRGIGQTTIDRVQAFADAQGISFYQALERAPEIDTIKRGAGKLQPFLEQIEGYRAGIDKWTLAELLDHIVKETGYVAELLAEGTDEAQSRIENIEELFGKIRTYEEETDEPSLADFLQQVSLVADIDNLDEDSEYVVLMTLHGAKGLEFNQVFLVGMEDGLFPSYMSIMADDETEIEEERRLCYVGITRARRRLYMTAARQRMVHGQTQYNPVSRFVLEVPAELTQGAVPKERREERPSSFSFGGVGSDGYSFGSSLTAIPKSYGRSQKEASSKKPTTSYRTKSAPKQELSQLGYTVGDRVEHFKFGVGSVTGIVDGGRDFEVTVDFDGFGTKKMFAAFAKLSKI